MSASRTTRAGFTLIELLLALAIFSMVSAMAAGVFWSISKAWNRGGEMLEQLHYGEFAMEQLVAALRGAAWFPSKPEAFGFWLEDDGGTSKSAANRISWVTSGTAFLPPDSPFQHGLHRISVTVEGSGEDRGLVVRAWPHLAEEMEERDVESWRVSPGVEGFSCEWYNFDEERWSQDWEETNSLPKLLRVTLNMQEREAFDESLELQRLVELEVAPVLPGRERRDRTTGDSK
ncbi:MAG: prepilin-type N-terminal cleavage/methylation domain-containing protein [Lentisphaerae bacterium]|nr:prepilin-type N-terminal cleavage/methylation domain-containing protein [Lentisphaerota bacterium]